MNRGYMDMKERLTNLLTVKSIVTILITLVFCALAIQSKPLPEQFLTIFTVIISFYFGTQAKKE